MVGDWNACCSVYAGILIGGLEEKIQPLDINIFLCWRLFIESNEVDPRLEHFGNTHRRRKFPNLELNIGLSYLKWTLKVRKLNEIFIELEN